MRKIDFTEEERLKGLNHIDLGEDGDFYAEYLKAALESKQQEKVQAALEEAKRTGKQVVIQQTYTDCDGSVEECSTDIVTEYAMPDGTIKVTRTHTF